MSKQLNLELYTHGVLASVGISHAGLVEKNSGTRSLFLISLILALQDDLFRLALLEIEQNIPIIFVEFVSIDIG